MALTQEHRVSSDHGGPKYISVAADVPEVATGAQPGTGPTAAALVVVATTAPVAVAAASGTSGLAEVAAPEVPAPAVAPAVAAKALVAWAPVDEPAMVEELLGRGALATKWRSLPQEAEHLAQGKRAE